MSVDDGGNISWGDSPLIINPWDEYAVEEALALRDQHGGRITVLSMGPEGALEALKHAIAMGCDDAVRLWDETFVGSDSVATGYVLAKAIEKLEAVDIVLCGKSAIDAETWQTGTTVARQLGVPALMVVIKIVALEPDRGTITVEQLFEDGRQVVTAPLPAVVGTTKGINEPRYTSFRGIRQAARMAYRCWSLEDLDAERERAGAHGSAVRWLGVTSPPARAGGAEMIEGQTAEESARLLAAKLVAEQVI